MVLHPSLSPARAAHMSASPSFSHPLLFFACMRRCSPILRRLCIPHRLATPCGICCHLFPPSPLMLVVFPPNLCHHSGRCRLPITPRRPCPSLSAYKSTPMHTEPIAPSPMLLCAPLICCPRVAAPCRRHPSPELDLGAHESSPSPQKPHTTKGIGIV